MQSNKWVTIIMVLIGILLLTNTVFANDESLVEALPCLESPDGNLPNIGYCASPQEIVNALNNGTTLALVEEILINSSDSFILDVRQAIWDCGRVRTLEHEAELNSEEFAVSLFAGCYRDHSGPQVPSVLPDDFIAPEICNKIVFEVQESGTRTFLAWPQPLKLLYWYHMPQGMGFDEGWFGPLEEVAWMQDVPFLYIYQGLYHGHGIKYYFPECHMTFEYIMP